MIFMNQANLYFVTIEITNMNRYIGKNVHFLLSRRLINIIAEDNICICCQSLGFPKESPMLNKKHETVLRYTDGSVCPEDPNRLISSNFTFPCDYNDKVIN